MKWFFLFLLFPLALSGQSVDSLQFHKVQADISHHSITHVMQDKQGFLWFATRYGLNRFDGEEVISFYNEASAHGRLSNSFVSDMALDDSGNIWIGTFGGGVNLYNDQNGRIEHKVVNDEVSRALSNSLVTSIIKDHQGHFWISTEKTGLFEVDPVKGSLQQYSHYADDPTSLSDNYVSGLAEDGQGNIWSGTWGKGMNLFLRQSQRFVRFSAATHPEIPHDIVRCISPSSKGHVWVGYQTGLRKISYENGQYQIEKIQLKNKELQALLEGITVLSVLEDSQSRLWVGTENKGLIVIDQNKGTYKSYWRDAYNAQSIGSNSIWSLYEDRSGTIWIGTFDQGVFKVDPYEKSFTHVYQTQNPQNALSHNLVSAFAEDQEGNIYIGTDGGGLNLLRKEGEYEHYRLENSALRSNAILCLQMDSRGDLWVGSWEGGLSVRRKNSRHFQNFPIGVKGKGSLGKNIFDLYEDSKKRLWIASSRSGLDVYLPEKDTFYHFTTEDPKRKILSNNIQVVMEDGEGNIWVGTEGSGLDKLVLNEQLETVALLNYNSQAEQGQKISHNFISCLFLDRKKRLWAGTLGGGINWYDDQRKQFINITKEDGLPSNLIYAIEEDLQGNLWLSTNKGLASYSPETGVIETYNTEDGLQAMEFFSRSSFRKKDGELLFGGINGFNRFYQEGIQDIPLNGKLYITHFNSTAKGEADNRDPVGDQNILHAPSLDLDYSQNDFSVSFSFLNYTQAAKNQYKYKLEGYDKDWQDIGTRNTAFYTNVPAGKYTFRVRAANSDRRWSEEEASLGIMIRSPWYATYWAYTVYIVLIILFLLWRRNSIIQREQLNSKLQLEHLELKKMKELDEIKSHFFANISHEFRTPLTLILSPLRSMYYDERWMEQRPRIKSMVQQAERLLCLINQILDLSKLEAGSTRLEVKKTDLITFLKPLVYSFTNLAERQYIKYKISFPSDPVYVYTDRDKIEKVVSNLLSNAFKFTPEFGEITFSMQVLKNEIKITVADTGEGIAEEEVSQVFTRYYQGTQKSQRHSLGTGIGLALSKELVELHKGRIVVESTKGTGAVFHVYFPLNTEHASPGEIMETAEVQAPAEVAQSLESEEDAKKPEKQVKKKGQKQTLLIAEDNEDIRAYLKEYLAAEFEILEADNGDRAYELALEQKPDLIITDILMPGMDGFGLCQKLKEKEETSYIPTVILTAKASEESVEKGYVLGADYYITKPFNPHHLRLQINNILKARNTFKTQLLRKNHLKLNPKNVEVTDGDEAFIKQVVSIIEAHMEKEDFTINDICKEIGMSRMQLYRKLKTTISMSANELIRHVRMQRAAQLMKQGQLSIAEITYMVGFTDLQYFRSCFKKQFGVNPSEYLQIKRA